MRKISLFALLLIFAVSFLSPIGKAQFSDVPESHPYFEAIEFTRNQNIVNGYSDGQFRPENKVNRAEFVKILIETLFSEEVINQCVIDPQNFFSDVPTDIWFAKYVCQAKKHNIIDGYPDGTFGPTLNIIFAESGKIISESAKLVVPRTRNQEWFEPYITSLENQNAVPSELKSPIQELTRGQMAEIIFRLRSQFGFEESSPVEVPVNNFDFAEERQQVLDIVNQERANAGLEPFQYSPFLEKSAQEHSDDMQIRNYFSHDTPEKTTSDERIENTGYYDEFFACNCPGRLLSGENIAKGQNDPTEVMETWMNSDQHRASILNPNFKEMGVGITPVKEADTGFTGYIWVQNFGGIHKE